jgi:hypothetical protein
VVTPSTRPVMARSFRTATSVVSRKSCIETYLLMCAPLVAGRGLGAKASP